MDDIAREVGVSRPTVYTYFASKKAVVLEVMVHQAADLLARVGSRVEHLQGLERVVEVACLGIFESMNNPYFRSIISGGEATDWAAAVLRSERFREVEHAFLTPIVEQAIDAGELRGDRSVEEIIDWIIFQQFAYATHADALSLSQAKIRHDMQTYLAAALKPRG